MDRSPANYLVTVKGNYSLFKSLLDLLTCIELKAQSIFVTKFKKKRSKYFIPLRNDLFTEPLMSPNRDVQLK